MRLWELYCSPEEFRLWQAMSGLPGKQADEVLTAYLRMCDPAVVEFTFCDAYWRHRDAYLNWARATASPEDCAHIEKTVAHVAAL